ncbi:hypothetical protein C8R45DRAFT_918263 [Mycena sanguinolenta]|nr:hypothetical protein C8R45DRAFT_918263 [Mycena sanguinolenta]
MTASFVFTLAIGCCTSFLVSSSLILVPELKDKLPLGAVRGGRLWYYKYSNPSEMKRTKTDSDQDNCRHQSGRAVNRMFPEWSWRGCKYFLFLSNLCSAVLKHPGGSVPSEGLESITNRRRSDPYAGEICQRTEYHGELYVFNIQDPGFQHGRIHSLQYGTLPPSLRRYYKLETAVSSRNTRQGQSQI